MLKLSMPPPALQHPGSPLGLAEQQPMLSINSAADLAKSPSQRPKLSLKTSSLPFNCVTSSTASTRTVNPAVATATPTTANTFNNTWDLSFRPSPSSTTASPRPPQLSQLSSVATIKQPDRPYVLNLPFGVRSILKNSPLPPRSSVSASPRDGRRRVFFPQPKRVAFKRLLEEVIETNEFTARHSDLASSEDDLSSTDTSRSNSDDECETASSTHSSPPPSRKRKSRKDSGVFIPKSNPTLEADAHVSTPRVDRKKRRWEWTLGSTDLGTDKGQPQKGNTIVVSTATTSCDSIPSAEGGQCGADGRDVISGQESDGTPDSDSQNQSHAESDESEEEVTSPKKVCSSLSSTTLKIEERVEREIPKRCLS